MIPLALIIKDYEKNFVEKYNNRLLPSHFKAMHAIRNCRSIHSPKMLMQCESKKCSKQTLVPHSCGHRHCPNCQNHETDAWITKQLQKLLPADYFMITFTLPAQFRSIAWYKQRTIYTLLFNSAWATIKTFCLNDKELGGIPGAIAVLHTHSRELNFHPHIHLLVPAATLEKTKRLWKKKRGKYLFNHKALGNVFSAKMLNGITTNNLKLPSNYSTEWIVDCKYVGKGRKALLYLSRYLYRGVIRENDILSCRNGQVTFRYKNSKTKKFKIKTISAVDFLWLVLQHVLPRGFRRARNYGLLHPNSKKLIKILQWVSRMDTSFGIKMEVKPRKKMICPCCGAFMKIVKTGIPSFDIIPVPT